MNAVMDSASFLPTSTGITRRRMMQTSLGGLGLSVPTWLQMQSAHAAPVPAANGFGKARSCIVLFCWGGISHLESWDPKPDAPRETRGEFKPIATAVPGIQVSEHMPLLAKQTDKLAIVRSIHHAATAHGKGMYWNLTGHPPRQFELAQNQPPSPDDWPSLGAMITALRTPDPARPSAVRLPYPLVDNGTLQAGEFAGWLGSGHDPIVVRTPQGKPFGGVSRDLGSLVLNLADGIDRPRLQSRLDLLRHLEQSLQPGNGTRSASGGPSGPAANGSEHFRQLAANLLLSESFKRAFKLEDEPQPTRAAYGEHICGQSMLLARRLVEVGVPIVTVCCAAGDLNGSKGDHWDTHGDNFNRLKNTMLPSFDKPAAALLTDLADRGMLDETLVVFLTEFGRTPKINGGAGRDHYPFAYSVALAGGGIEGGQVYGSTDAIGAHPAEHPCGPNDLHATIFHAMGIPIETMLHDQLQRPMPITDGHPLPLF